MRIGILEDEQAVADKIISFVRQYFAERDREVETTYYPDAFALIENYHANLDVLFMDIQMNVMNGMEAAGYIRQRDPHVIIVFVTNLAQYAVDGYAVNAFDFILKPVDYHGFAMKLDRICKELEHRKPDEFITVKTKAEVLRLNISDILYVEVRAHDLTYHTKQGNVIARGTLKTLAQELGKRYFSQCSNCYLVNLAHVRKANKTILLSNGEELFISQGKRKQFMSELAKYIGGTI